jgi:hypothetical protein
MNILRINCARIWLYLQDYTETHGQQNLKLDWKDKRILEGYGTGTGPKYSSFIMMIMMMNFLIFCVIPNYKLFNFSTQRPSLYIIYTHLSNMDSKQLRSEFSFYCVHILIFSVKVMAVCQAETCRRIKAEINNCCVWLDVRCFLQTCRAVIAYWLGSTEMSHWNFFQCFDSPAFNRYRIGVAKTIKIQNEYTKVVEITGGFIITFLVMKTAKWFERYYKMAPCRKTELYHNQL